MNKVLVPWNYIENQHISLMSFLESTNESAIEMRAELRDNTVLGIRYTYWGGSKAVARRWLDPCGIISNMSKSVLMLFDSIH